MSPLFEKLPSSLLCSKKGQRLLDVVTAHIAKQAESSPNQIDFGRLALIPPHAQTIYWVWIFQCEAGTGGMDVFILNSLGMYSPQIHDALKEVGANELVRQLEAAISFARRGPAEFRQLPDQSWFNQFSVNFEFPTLEAINEATFSMLGSLREAAVTFIKENEDVFFG